MAELTFRGEGLSEVSVEGALIEGQLSAWASLAKTEKWPLWQNFY